MAEGRGTQSKVAYKGWGPFDVTLRLPSAESAMRSWDSLSETSGSQEAGMSYHQRIEINFSMKLLMQMAAEQKYEPIIGFRPFNGRCVPAKCPG